MLSDIAFAQHSPEHLLQAGVYAEEIKGDLPEALKFYQKIVQDFPDNRPVAAKAQLQIGICYEKLGQQKAIAAYQKVLENYPDQSEIVARARERLTQSKIRDQKSKIHPLTKYYFERLGIDITTSTSYDGKYLAYTDWTTGSLMIKENDFGFRNADFGALFSNPGGRNPQSVIRIVEADLSRSPEYAYWPVWSHDGKFIAYSWYRKPYHVELRVVSVADGRSWIAYSEPGLIINPHDWSPDGRTIVCETLDFHREPFKWLALVRADSKELQAILPLDAHSRGMKFSPDGKYIVYDLKGTARRDIHVLAWKDSLQNQALNVEFPSLDGADAPVWSADGKLILCRTIVQNDLWAIPMNQGKVVAKPYLVQTDLTNAFLATKGIRHPTLAEANRATNKKTAIANVRNIVRSFEEEFSSPILDSAWSVFEWKGPNVYDYPSFGRYSLTDRPGHLRYYSDPMMNQGYLYDDLPHFSGWYWFYPSLEISRTLAGDHWVLEAKATYCLVDGANGRDFDLVVSFDQERDQQTALRVQRRKDIQPESNWVRFRLFDRGIVMNEGLEYRSPKDTLGVSQFAYIYRVTRADTLIHVELSDDDGKSFQQVFSASLRPELRGLPQLLSLTGESWFVPAGAYVDWDYIRFRNADF